MAVEAVVPVAAVERAPAAATKSVVFLGVGPDGCGWYRGVQPVAALAAVGVRASIQRHLTRTFKGAVTVALKLDADTLVIQRPLPPEMPSVVACAAKEGRRVVIELDDDVWSMAPHNPAARHFGRATLDRLAECCRLAHCVIVSTAPLAARVRAVTGQREIVVIPNAVDPALAGPERTETSPIIVGWAGGASHRADFRVARDAVIRAQSLPGVDVHFYGDDPLCGPPPTPGPRAIHGWTADMATHYRNISGFHIGLAPVENSRFNRSKSSLKWIEYSLHSTAAILSAVPCYEGFAVHGETALLAADKHEWERALMRLMRDEGLRRELGEAAREEVLARHTIAHRLPLYREVLAL
jgi:glycosyltransferase involved in cell wall biosynthesis